MYYMYLNQCRYTKCSVLYFTVKRKGELHETVTEVLKQEMLKIHHGKDAKTLNTEFMERNNRSLLHRLAGRLDYMLITKNDTVKM